MENIMLVNENLQDVLIGKDRDEMIEDLKKKTFEQKWMLIDDWWSNSDKFILDIRNYMGGFKFDDMIIMKQRGEL